MQSVEPQLHGRERDAMASGWCGVHDQGDVAKVTGLDALQGLMRDGQPSSEKGSCSPPGDDKGSCGQVGSRLSTRNDPS